MQLKPTNDKAERLDKVLVELLGLSRSKVQSAIKDGRVTVNGKIANAHLAIDVSDEIEFVEGANGEKGVKGPEGEIAKLDIIYEDDDVIVVNKPAGLLVHPAPATIELTLVDALVAHDPKIKNVGDEKKRAGIVHRLDRDASGVLIVAKTDAAFEHLKAQFVARKTKKIYSVLVHGQMEKDHDTITFPIGRSKTRKGRMASRPSSSDLQGREAITHYDVVTQFPHLTLLDVRIETGRTHQIRSHLFAIGHPVAGDTLYAQKQFKAIKLGRLFLHAKELTITLPSGEEKTFKAPLPADLRDLIERLPKK